MTSPTYSTYSLPCSRIRPMPSSSAFRYGFSIDYTDPFLSGQQFYPAWASSRSLLAKEDAGLMVPPSACALRVVGMKTVCYTARPYSADVGPPGRAHSFIPFPNIFEP